MRNLGRPAAAMLVQADGRSESPREILIVVLAAPMF
jgi:hypothetical protein